MKTTLLGLFAISLAVLAVNDARADDAGADAGASGPPDATVPELATGLAVKEGCSCVFIVQQPDAYCTGYGAPAAYVEVHLQIDHTAKSVRATFLGATRSARFVDGAGCTLDP